VRIATLSSALAPVVLIGGFELAAAQQPAGYSAVHDTISALARHGATDRWIMTSAFAVLGLCHLTTAWGLRRPLLALGGAATALLALAPEPRHGSSGAHLVIATIALIALAIWPAFTSRAGTAAAVLMAGLLVWFLIALRGGAAAGVAERAVTSAEALWPIVAVRLGSPSLERERQR
jgi:hypothetical membrane protein